MTPTASNKEHRYMMTCDKKCVLCGGKFTITGVIKSVTRRKTCPTCKRKNRDKNNAKSNEKKRLK
jgi:hypothetical protein